MPGRLIAIEGGEGAGKSTQAARLAHLLGASLTREPGGTPTGERIRQILLDRDTGLLDDRTELLLMLAARAQHLAEHIGPELARGGRVVVDRFSGSTLAYQGFGRGLPLAEVRTACELAAGGRWPDLNVLLDVPVETGEQRRSSAPDRFEAEARAFHERVRHGFLALAAEDGEHWRVVDGTRGVEDVAAAVRAAVAERFGDLG